MRFKVSALAAILSIVNLSVAGPVSGKDGSAALARKAVSEGSAESAAAIAALRSQGPSGLDAFLDSHAAEFKSHQPGLDKPVPQDADAAWRRLNAALDAICQQRDCFSSRLYWHTDLEEAKRAARASGKPILSLRLLGRLDEELSCANSRLFRITLYANAEVSKFLRERFILHWQSVRPVPKVTIDFGDGRRLERTLTGNSIHYILDREGRLVDALPGLYGPQAFLRELARAEQSELACRAARTEEERLASLREYHMARAREINVSWATDITRLKISRPSRDIPRTDSGRSDPPEAEAAIRGAITKMIVVERPLLRGISSEPKALDPKQEDSAWEMIGSLHAEDARLDAGSKSLMRGKNPSLYVAADGTDRVALDRDVRNLERAIAEDTARNEYVFHAKIHEWLASPGVATDVDRFNERVYAELFLTPGSDPWLGLFPRDSYTAIENDGIRR